MPLHFEYPVDPSEIFKVGRTSSAGNAGGTSVVDTSLIGADIPIGSVILLYYDNPTLSTWRQVLSFSTVTGTIIVAMAFSAQVPADAAYALLVDGALSVGPIPGAIASGTFTTSSTTVPADLNRTEANNYHDGNLIMPLSGAIAFETRRIRTFANAGGVFTLDPAKPFSAAPGLVPYVILPSQAQYRAVTNSADNTLMSEVLGAKDDTAILTPGANRSELAYMKGVVTHINGTQVTGESGAANIGAGAVDIISLAADGNRKELNGVFLSMTGSGASVTAGATVTIRVYRAINGVERQVDQFTVIKGTDPDGIPIVNSWVPIESNALGAVTAFRVSMQGSNPADNAVLVPFCYTTRLMQF